MADQPWDLGVDRENATIDHIWDTPIWIVLSQPGAAKPSGTAQHFDRCGTAYLVDLLVPSVRYCDEEAAAEVTVRCRACGWRTFEVCGLEFADVVAGVLHVGAWCVYCTQALSAHEIVEVLMP